MITLQEAKEQIEVAKLHRNELYFWVDLHERMLEGIFECKAHIYRVKQDSPLEHKEVIKKLETELKTYIKYIKRLMETSQKLLFKKSLKAQFTVESKQHMDKCKKKYAYLLK